MQDRAHEFLDTRQSERSELPHAHPLEREDYSTNPAIRNPKKWYSTRQVLEKLASAPSDRPRAAQSFTDPRAAFLSGEGSLPYCVPVEHAARLRFLRSIGRTEEAVRARETGVRGNPVSMTGHVRDTQPVQKRK